MLPWHEMAEENQNRSAQAEMEDATVSFKAIAQFIANKRGKQSVADETVRRFLKKHGIKAAVPGIYPKEKVMSALRGE